MANFHIRHHNISTDNNEIHIICSTEHNKTQKSCSKISVMTLKLSLNATHNIERVKILLYLFQSATDLYKNHLLEV